jgi:HEAT repeat protein
MLRIGDRDTRAQAAHDLAAAHCDEKARLALERALLCDAETQVRRVAAESLDRLGDTRALPSLRQAYATDANREVRQAAYRGIIMLEGY